MRGVDKKKLFRIIDANFNRSKEGLRVCEDICRFILDKRTQTQQLKNIRHEVKRAYEDLGGSDLFAFRSIETDVGRQSGEFELKRKDIKDIFLANIGRVKESLRVLEEMAKLINTDTAARLKKMRYRVYALEKNIAQTL